MSGGGFSKGDVNGPGNSTNNSVARFDGVTGKLIKGSGPSFTFDGDTLNLPFDTVSQHITVGASADLTLDHDGTDSHIINNTGRLVIESNGGALDISGAGGGTSGGDITLTSGSGTANGGDVILRSGGGASATSGIVLIEGGSATTTGVGGDIFLTAGDGGNTSGKGGDITLLSGDAGGSGEDSGDITIDTGIPVDGLFGDILMARSVGSVGIGVSQVVLSALLELSSTTKGFLPPRMTTTQRDAISSPATGLEIYNTTLNEPQHFDGSTWLNTGAVDSVSGGANINITGTASDPIINLDDVIEFADGSTQDTGSTPDGIGWHPSALSDSLQSFSLATQNDQPLAIFVRADGLKLYMSGNTDFDVFEYDMTIPWDVSTLSFLQTIDTNEGAPRGLYFKPDGTKFYIVRFTGLTSEWTMTTPWDITTATKGSTFAAVGGAQGTWFKPDGLSYYVNGTSNIIRQYNLSTAWDLSTASDPTISFTADGPAAVSFRPDGRSMYAMDATTIYEYELPTPWDITTASLIDSKITGIGNHEVIFKPDGTKAIVLDASTDLVHEFNLGILTSLVHTDGMLSTDDVKIQADTGATVQFSITDDTTADQFSLIYNDATGASDLIALSNLTISSVSGSIEIQSADGDGADAGELIKFQSGDGGATSGNGGGMSFISGNGLGGDADSGSILIESGTPDGSGIFGSLNLQSQGGNVGIGIALQDPSATLDVGGNASITDELTLQTGQIVSPDGTSGVNISIISGDGSAGNGGDLLFRSGDGAGSGGIASLIAGDGTFAGGPVNITSGNVAGTGVAGLISILGGVSGGSSAGAQVHVFGGIGGDASGTGGQVLVHAGSGGNSDGDGGLLSLEGGQGFSSGNSDGGDVDIQGGQNFGTGDHGNVLLQQTEGFVGIGTGSPSTILDIQSDSNPTVTMRSTADFGQANLELYGSRNQGDGNATVAQLRGFNTRSGGDIETSRISFINGASGTNAGGLAFHTRNASGSITERMRIDEDGIVTIDDEVVSTISEGATEVYSLDDLPAPSGGVITLPSGLYIFKAPINFGTNRLDITGSSIQMYAEHSFVNSLTYEGTGTFITSTDTATFRVFYPGITFILSGDGATFVDMIGSFGVDFSSIILSHANGGNLGTISGRDTGVLTSSRFFLTRSVVRGWLTGFDISDTGRSRAETITTASHANASTGFLRIKDADDLFYVINGDIEINNVNASLLDIDPTNTEPIYMNNLSLKGVGSYFQPGTTGTFFSVTDASVALTEITGVTDSSGTARFAFTGPTLFVDQKVDIVNFVTETSYNQTVIITATDGTSFFETSIAFTGDDATGDFSSDSVTLAEVSTTLVDGDTIFIDTTAGTQYDGGFTVYNQLASTFRINQPFTITRAGTWDTASLDQTSPPVRSLGNTPLPDSHAIATAFVNDNSTANGAIVNNTFTDMVFGTGGGGLVDGSTMERWKLINGIDGIFEYVGNEEFDGLITFDFTVVSSGGAQDFRFKWLVDNGSGFVDLDDNVEALVNVGGSSQSVTKTFPLACAKGCQIKPQITRNSGTSGITTQYATIYATQ